MAGRIFSVVAKETSPPPPPPPVDEAAELRALIQQVREKAAAYIDKRAAQLAAGEAKGLPVNTIRNCIAGSDRSCPCAGALRIFLSDERDQEIKARQKQ